ncbi:MULTISPECIES: trypsin-like serine peptidase [Bacillus cereus group]|uniref:trypsin-like serine peptidase n=1 Tax=Bacillus cereus group TaxID=86661 RepID=UPI000BF0AB8D|nr:trypsin-like serine protease [Bacillus toyonensis]PEK09407.1 hypothetical protein CN681_14220 [Bacillus toyonensis]PGA50821.1 hypothetical protein COL86_28745 [Bacillus toyonensis]PGB97438.1 hypothetical protein COM19_19395 [Bacillus toyonensis]
MNSIVRLYFHIGSSNKKQSASASIIKFNNEFYIATAAHCLYDVATKEKAKNVYVELTKAKKVHLKIQTIIIPEKWKLTGDLSFDYAFGKIEDSSEISEFLVPNFDFVPGINDNSIYYFGGYPIKIFNTKLVLASGKVDSLHFEQGNLIGVPSKLTSGVSGGPLFLEDCNNRVQIGVASFKTKRIKEIVWVTSWNNLTKEILEFLSKSSARDGYIFI